MSRKNKSYPAELKYQAVADYLSGAGSLRAICKKYKIGNKKRLQDWIKLYNSHKELKCHTGGSRMTKGRDTTYEERIALVHECVEKGYNYTGIAQKHKVGYTFTSREQLISTIENYIDYYNNRRYQHKLFIQTPMQAHVSAMNRAAQLAGCTKNSPFLW